MTTKMFEKMSVSLFELTKEELISRIKEIRLGVSGAMLDFENQFLEDSTKEGLIHILMGAMTTIM
jgi:hypothetical protein